MAANIVRSDPAAEGIRRRRCGRGFSYLGTDAVVIKETCYLPLFGTGSQVAERIRDSIADHDEIRGMIGEAAVQPAGSAPWWRTVRRPEVPAR